MTYFVFLSVLFILSLLWREFVECNALFRICFGQRHISLLLHVIVSTLFNEIISIRYELNLDLHHPEFILNLNVETFSSLKIRLDCCIRSGTSFFSHRLRHLLFCWLHIVPFYTRILLILFLQWFRYQFICKIT